MTPLKSFSVFELDRPETANALDLNSAKLLSQAVKKAVSRNELGLIIASHHPRIFCSGGDLQVYSKTQTKSKGVSINRQIRKILQELASQPILVVAAVEGEAIGGGCELALACDWIVASGSSAFSFRQVNQHLIPGWGGGHRLLKRVRPSISLDWLTSGRRVGAQEAFRCGLVDQLCAKGTTLAESQEFLRNRAPLSAALLKAAKLIVGNGAREEEKFFNQLWFKEGHRKALKSR